MWCFCQYFPGKEKPKKNGEVACERGLYITKIVYIHEGVIDTIFSVLERIIHPTSHPHPIVRVQINHCTLIIIGIDGDTYSF